MITIRQLQHIIVFFNIFIMRTFVAFCLFCAQALCILTNIANGKTAKDDIMGNDDLVGKIVSYLVHFIIISSSYQHFCIVEVAVPV